MSRVVGKLGAAAAAKKKPAAKGGNAVGKLGALGAAAGALGMGTLTSRSGGVIGKAVSRVRAQTRARTSPASTGRGLVSRASSGIASARTARAGAGLAKRASQRSMLGRKLGRKK